MKHGLILITLCLSIFLYNNANENQMPESLKQDILKGEVQSVIDHLNQNPNDINLKTTIDNYEHTALMLAIKSDSLPMFNVVLSKTQNVNETNKNEITPLMSLSKSKISEENQLIFAELLLQNGASIDAQNIDGDRALILAISNKYLKLARFLINKDSNVNLTNRSDETALLYVLQAICEAANEDLKKDAIDIAKLLIQKGTDLNHVSDEGITPLIMAIYYLNIDLVIFLLNNGAKINFIAKHSYKNNYKTALIYAISLRSDYSDDSNKKYMLYSIIQLLIDKKAALSYHKTNVRYFIEYFIDSPLSLVVKNYDFEIVKLLVEAKADIYEKNPANKSALGYAREYYKKENDPKIKQKRKRILRYLENPYKYLANEDRVTFTTTFLNYDRQTNVPENVTNIIANYIHEPEKIDGIDQIKEYLRNNDINNVRSILKISPTVVTTKDEIGDTPLILMIKYYYYDKYINNVDESILLNALLIIDLILYYLINFNEYNYLKEQLRTAKLLATELQLHEILDLFKPYERSSLTSGCILI